MHSMMDNDKSISITQKKFSKLLIIRVLAIFSGLALSVMSLMNLCSQACAEGHNYRLYGLRFEYIGIGFFSFLLFVQLLSSKIPSYSSLIFLLIAGALGSEIMFIYAQKYIIGQWCLVCLGIATSVFIAALTITVDYLVELKLFIKNRQKGEFMKSICKAFFFITIATGGFLFSQLGFVKFNQLHAAENSIKDSIAFGNLESPLEVYVFTDWECPSCRKIDPILEEMFPEITKNARLIFVDFVIHPESMNFTPYNLSFMIKDKAQYMKLRDLLTDVSLKTSTPTDQDIEKAIKPLGAKYEQLNYADVAVAIKYFKHVGKQFGVDRTPTVVIVNKNQKKGKKLIGASEITKENITKAIDSLR
jgi:thiol-disulfide isomerase/thioredoxin